MTLINIPENILSNLSDEQKKRVEAAKTPEELLALAKEAGYELPPDALEAANGGWCLKCKEYHCNPIEHGL